MSAGADRRALAHLAADGREHDLDEHLSEVGRLASEFAESWGAGKHARIAGLLHDLGKRSPEFQTHLRGAVAAAKREDAHLEPDDPSGAAGSPSARGRVDHSTAGALAARALGPVGELLAFVIAGHHAGLADHQDLKDRLLRKQDLLALALGGASQAPSIGALPSPFATKPHDRADAARLRRRLELWTRMLFSALCDADFLDTERFFDAALASLRMTDVTLLELRDNLVSFLNAKEAAARDTEVNRVRREVRAAAAATAAMPPGVFTLTVPTGGGKTLAGMELALRHATQHGLRRVVVAIPYTSIIEQNAAVYRQAFGAVDDPRVEHAVIEHHASFDPRRETGRSRLATQNWDMPVVVTTNVQLLESLFANRTSRCRKLHNLARSVILLDEAQTMPPGLLEPTLEVLSELIDHYGVSLIISTATQPAWFRESLGRFGLPTGREAVPAEVRAFERLRRVEMRWPRSLAPTPYQQIADAVVAEPDVLAITHRRDDARRLTELCDERTHDTSTVHLSALMCAEHRSEVLAAIQSRKRADEPVRVVSTQLVEAGVDLDFAVVYRALAGLDSLAQAAGRCNREGLRERGELRVFVADTQPPKGVPQTGLAITQSMLRANPDLDLFAAEPHRAYFERLYGAANTDAKNIQDPRERLDFKTVAQRYALIEDDWSAPVVVRFGRATSLLETLGDRGPSRAILRALGRFTVNVPRDLVQQWLHVGDAIQDESSGVVALAEHVDAYDLRFGLVPERVSSRVSAQPLVIDG